MYSPNQKLFNYRKNTLMTDEEGTDGETELQFKEYDDWSEMANSPKN